MYLILFLVGIVLAFTGALLVHLSVPVVDVAAAALFNSGIIAIVGGLILLALAAVVRTVGRIADRFELQPLPLPPIAAVEHEDPAPRPARAPAAAKRSSLMSWFGTAGAPANGAKAAANGKPAPADGEPAPANGKPAPANGKPAPVPEPAVDLAALARIPEEPRVAVPPPAPPPAPGKPVAPPLRAPARPVPEAAAPEATVYKSGVIEGMAYTLYMDGSIEAELPQGKVRFASVEELQKHLTAR